MTKRKTLLLVVTGLALIGLTFAQSAPACPECPMQPAPAAEPAGFGGLDLTSDQLDKLDQLRMNHLREVMPLETDLEIKEMELEALWRADQLDSKKIVAKVKEIAGVRTQIELSRVDQRLGTYNLLTPEQREKARKFMGRFVPGMGRGHGAMGQGRMRGMRQGMGRMGRGMGRMGRGMGRMGRGMGMMGQMHGPQPGQGAPCPDCQHRQSE